VTTSVPLAFVPSNKRSIGTAHETHAIEVDDEASTQGTILPLFSTSRIVAWHGRDRLLDHRESLEDLLEHLMNPIVVAARTRRDAREGSLRRESAHAPTSTRLADHLVSVDLVQLFEPATRLTHADAPKLRDVLGVEIPRTR
jgi:hypothetical protein